MSQREGRNVDTSSAASLGAISINGEIKLHSGEEDLVSQTEVAKILRGIWAEQKVAVKVLKVLRGVPTIKLQVRRLPGQTVPFVDFRLQRVVGEIILWTQLRHENVLPVLGVCTDVEEMLSLVTPWVELGSATQFVHSYVTLNPSILVRQPYFPFAQL
jgi:hypothetical protein